MKSARRLARLFKNLRHSSNPRRPATPPGRTLFSSKTGKLRNFILQQDGLEQEIPTIRKLAINNGDAIVAAALAGIGICQLPTFMVQGYLTEGKLEKLLEDYGVGSLPINALYPQNRHLSSKVRAFIEWVAELFAECKLLQKTK